MASLDVVRNMGFTRTTPVQAGTIPRSMKNQDCVVEVSRGFVLVMRVQALRIP